jgi:hypothetical protein
VNAIEVYWAAGVVVVHQPAKVGDAGAAAGPDRHLQPVQDQAGPHGGGGPPAQDAPGVGVDDERHVHHARPGRHVGKIGYPQAVRRVRAEPALHQVGRAAAVNKARTAAQKKADSLQAQNAKVAAGASQWWTDVQASWSTHVAQLHDDVETRKADRDAKKAQHRADRAEDDAIAAVAFAEAALEEAEYAVLDAQLARLEAESTGM